MSYYSCFIPVMCALFLGCSAGEMRSVDVTPAAFNAADGPTVQFSVPDMMCVDGCAVAVKEILAKQPGVKEVLVDFDAKTATVAVDKENFDAEKALAALVDKRFDNSNLKGGGEDIGVGAAGAESDSAPTKPQAAAVQ